MKEKLTFTNDEEFDEYMFETIHNILLYCGKDKERFKSFCTSFYSVIYVDEYEEQFKEATKQIEELMKKPIGIILLDFCRKQIKEARKEGRK